MNQPELVLSCAIAAALIGTVAIAGLSRLPALRVRVGCAAVQVAALAFCIGAVISLGLRVNLTPSMPMGIYRMMPTDGKGIQRGDIVIACAPLDAAELGRELGYLAVGACPMNTEPLLKEVVALADDVVDASRQGVAVNGKLLPNSNALRVDASGRKLTPWRIQGYRLRHGQVWLYANNARSWDSRYWGPVSSVSILARVRSLR